MKILPTVLAADVKTVSPSKTPGTMSFWHGGNMDIVSDAVHQKRGNWEYGPGLYLTTNYDIALRYARGNRKLYMVTVKKGVDAKDSYLDWNTVQDFIKRHGVQKNLRHTLDRMQKYVRNEKILATIFLNVLSDTHETIRKPIQNKPREILEFLIQNGIDYLTVSSPFGALETMMVLFNTKKIENIERVLPKDTVEVYDLPTTFKQ